MELEKLLLGLQADDQRVVEKATDLILEVIVFQSVPEHMLHLAWQKLMQKNDPNLWRDVTFKLEQYPKKYRIFHKLCLVSGVQGAIILAAIIKFYAANSQEKTEALDFIASHTCNAYQRQSDQRRLLWRLLLLHAPKEPSLMEIFLNAHPFDGAYDKPSAIKVPDQAVEDYCKKYPQQTKGVASALVRANLSNTVQTLDLLYEQTKDRSAKEFLYQTALSYQLQKIQTREKTEKYKILLSVLADQYLFTSLWRLKVAAQAMYHDISITKELITNLRSTVYDCKSIDSDLMETLTSLVEGVRLNCAEKQIAIDFTFFVADKITSFSQKRFAESYLQNFAMAVIWESYQQGLYFAILYDLPAFDQQGLNEALTEMDVTSSQLQIFLYKVLDLEFLSKRQDQMLERLFDELLKREATLGYEILVDMDSIVNLFGLKLKTDLKPILKAYQDRQALYDEILLTK